MRTYRIMALCALATLTGFLAGCHPWGALDNLADPKAADYQGYDTIADPAYIRVASPADKGSLRGTTVVSSKVLGAVAYGIRIAASEALIASAPLFAKTDYGSNEMDIVASGIVDGATYYCEVGAKTKSDGDFAWSPSTSFTASWDSAAAEPSFSPGGGLYSSDQSVTITAASGATIYYTTDGSDPSLSSTVYAAPILVAGDGNSVVIKAMARKAGYKNSAVASATYSLDYLRVDVPTYSLASGTYVAAQTVELSCGTAGASIRYSTDGIDPSSSSGTVYSAPISVSSSCTLKAIAYMAGMKDSALGSATYGFVPPAAPTITSAVGGAASATLAWASVEGATSYNLYYAQGGAASTASSRVELGNALWYTLGSLSTTVKYAFVLTAVGIGGESAASPVATATTTRIFALRDVGPAGGIIFYDKGNYSNGWRYLESARFDQGTGVAWGPMTPATGATSGDIGAGKRNTETIVAVLGNWNNGNYAAKLCYDLSLGGYDDWFLPSNSEQERIFPSWMAIGGFSNGAGTIYWNSTEQDIMASGESFSPLSYYGGLKTNANSVRAIREF